MLADAVLGAYFVQYRSLYDAGPVPNPLSRVGGKIEMFDSPATHTQFAFLEGKLFAVSISFDTENPLPSLEQKYGTTPAHGMQTGAIRYDVRAWFADKNRVIIYMRWLSEGVEVVTYVDSTLYNNVAAQLVQERKTESHNSLKRLD